MPRRFSRARISIKNRAREESDNGRVVLVVSDTIIGNRKVDTTFQLSRRDLLPPPQQRARFLLQDMEGGHDAGGRFQGGHPA